MCVLVTLAAVRVDTGWNVMLVKLQGLKFQNPNPQSLSYCSDSGQQ